MKQLIILFALALSNLTFAQYSEKNNEVKVLPTWQKGDVFEYIQNEKEYQITENDTIFKKNSTFDLNMEIINKSKKDYTIQWTIKADFSTFPPQLQKQLYDNFGIQKFIYTVNRDGDFIELLNFDEIKTYNKNLVETIGNTITNENDKIAFNTALEKVFGNEDVTAQLIVSKIKTFHLFYGHIIKKGTPLVTSFESVNPVTKNKIKYLQNFELEGYNSNDEVYTLYAETVPDHKNLKDEAKNTLETIISQEAKEFDLIKEFDFISKVFQVTHNSGIIVYQLKRDFINVDNQEIIKELEFILK